MCTFPGALNGLLAATDVLKRVSTDPVFIRDNLGVRVGLHHGDTLVEEADVYGDAVEHGRAHGVAGQARTDR